MPYWSILCVYCQGHISDALLECVPRARQREAGFRLLFQAQPGAALACPYCNALIGFDDQGQSCRPQSGWPVFRYSKAELELKKLSDGEDPATPLTDWALRCRFTGPGVDQPLTDYTYAEQVTGIETVP